MSNLKYNFIGCDKPYEESDIVIFGAPYDGTASFRAGSRFAPDAVRLVSDAIETYSPYADVDIEEDFNICDAGNVEFSFGNRELALSEINKKAYEIINDDKKFLCIGGEHLVSLPLVQAVKEKYEDLVIIHLDAHADLRDDYLGEKLSHATVMRRVSELVGIENIFQFGIRSGTRDEFNLMRDANTLDREISSVISVIENKPVYLTLDVDILDPSIMPGTGTPEAGGWTFVRILNFINSIRGLNIVSADVVEIAPDYDLSGNSSVTGAKLCREVLALL